MLPVSLNGSCAAMTIIVCYDMLEQGAAKGDSSTLRKSQNTKNRKTLSHFRSIW